MQRGTFVDEHARIAPKSSLFGHAFFVRVSRKKQRTSQGNAIIDGMPPDEFLPPMFNALLCESYTGPASQPLPFLDSISDTSTVF